MRGHHWHARRGATSLLYSRMRELGVDTFKMRRLELAPCSDAIELRAKEREWIKRLKPTLNRNVPGLTDAEWYADNREQIQLRHRWWYVEHREELRLRGREWYAEHKEEVKLRNRQWRAEHPEYVSLRNRAYYAANREELTTPIQCPCGGRFTLPNKSVHEKTKRHQAYLRQQAPALE